MLGLAGLLLLVIAVGGSALLAGAFVWLLMRRVDQVGPSTATDPQEIAGRQEELERQLESMQKELDRLTERVDFTEKLLERPRE